jgi:hypothetical protein
MEVWLKQTKIMTNVTRGELSTNAVSIIIVILMNHLVGFIIRLLKGDPLSKGIFDLFFEEEENYSH